MRVRCEKRYSYDDMVYSLVVGAPPIVPLGTGDNKEYMMTRALEFHFGVSKGLEGTGVFPDGGTASHGRASRYERVCRCAAFLEWP